MAPQWSHGPPGLGACAVTFLALFCGSVSALRFMGGTGNEPGATGWVLRMYRAWGEGRYLCGNLGAH